MVVHYLALTALGTLACLSSLPQRLAGILDLVILWLTSAKQLNPK